jgi:hypothetical protein
MRKIFALCILLALGAWSLVSCGDRLGTVEGVVSNAADGSLLIGAQVVVYSLEKAEGVGQLDAYTKRDIIQKQLTGEDGTYTFSLEAGTYVMQVWLEGLEVADRMVEVKSGRTTTADFEVAPPSP